MYTQSKQENVKNKKKVKIYYNFISEEKTTINRLENILYNLFFFLYRAFYICLYMHTQTAII